MVNEHLSMNLKSRKKVISLIGSGSCLFACCLFQTAFAANEPMQPLGQELSDCPDHTRDRIVGGESSDYLVALRPETCVVGAAGPDVLKVLFGADRSTVLGGDGNDIVFVGSVPRDAVVAGGAGHDDITVGAHGASVWGNAGDDVLKGGLDDDRLDAGSGNDLVSGFAGNDQLFGQEGDDVAIGGLGADSIEGGFGDDILHGDEGFGFFGGDDTIYPGPGRDEVYAGPGSDRVLIYAPCELAEGEVLDGGAGYDTLVTPLSVDELEEMGVVVLDFEKIEIEQNACLSECVEKPDCNDRGSCIDGTFPGDVTCDCEDRFAGAQCETCEENFSGSECVDCSERFEGEECDQCKSPYTGEHCESCEEPFTGPFCEQCISPYTGEGCKLCEYPFEGENCDQCPDGTEGPDCNACTPGDNESCGGFGDCIAGPDGKGARCDCYTGRVGAHCEISIREYSIIDNEGPDSFAIHAFPDPQDVGNRGVASFERMDLAPDGERCSWTKKVNIDAAGDVTIMYVNGSLYNKWNMRVVDPEGKDVDLGEKEDYSSKDTKEPGSAEAATFSVRKPGSYVVKVSSDKSCTDLPSTVGSFAVAIDNTTRALYTNFSSFGFIEGRDIGIQARLFDPSKHPAPTTMAESRAPEAIVGDQAVSMTLTLVNPDGTASEHSMYDDGAHDDGVARDGIYGAVIQARAGQNFYNVSAEGSTQNAHSYKRTSGQVLEVAKESVVVRRKSDPSLLIESTRDARAVLTIPLRPYDRSLDLSDEDVVKKLTAREILVTTELWAFNRTGTVAEPKEEPIAWISGFATPFIGQRDADSGKGSLVVELQVDPRWISNAARSGVFSEGVAYFQLRNLKLSTAKDRALLDEVDRLTWLIPRNVEAQIDELDTSRFYNPNDPENEEMTKGAPPEFIKETRRAFRKNGFPKTIGDIYAISGWCGRVDMWDPGISIDRSFVDSNGTPVLDRFIQPSFWFFRNNHLGRGGTQVHVSTFADELVRDLKETHNEVAEIWAFSQGGVAALEARRRWTPLELQQNSNKPAVQTLAAEFYGTPLASPVGYLPGTNILWSTFLPAARMMVRASLKCRLFAGQSVGLGPARSHMRMSSLPQRITGKVRDHATSHNTNNFLGFGEFCNRATSKIFLPEGPDDGIVTLSSARLPESLNQTLGGETWKAWCHHGDPHFFKHKFSASSVDINKDMCKNSIFGEIGACK